MKNFIYKFAIVLIGLFFLFELTIGSKIKNFKRDINNSYNKENITELKDKIREELNSANEKDQILSKEDALILKKFFNKISNEIKNAN
tara:strand:- start:343 stop:606 length:264 start_codon:yes stop_codon:yes gene_type:complete